MKRIRVLAFMDEDLVPPDDIKGLSEEDIEPWRTEWDVVSTLRGMGHEVTTLGLREELLPLRTMINDWKPDIAFNILEEFQGEPTYDYLVVSYLESLGMPCTGCNARGLILARDKALSKKLFAYHRIRTPDFVVIPMNTKVKRPKRLEFPLIVKSLVEEASLGIAQASVVDSDEKLAERVKFIHESIKTDALVEKYIEGRELYVGVVGNQRLQVLPVWELVFNNMPADAPLIATRRVKWNRAYQKKRGIESRAAKDLSSSLQKEIARLSKRIYRVLGLSGYARLDFRLSSEEHLHVLEVNPNPQVARGEDLADSAAAASLPYEKFLQRIINIGLERRGTP